MPSLSAVAAGRGIFTNIIRTDGWFGASAEAKRRAEGWKFYYCRPEKRYLRRGRDPFVRRTSTSGVQWRVLNPLAARVTVKERSGASGHRNGRVHNIILF